MRVIEHEQRSDGWFAARLGIPTASGFHKLITPTGKKAASFDRYVNDLIAEKITGESTYVPVTEAMQRGTDMEPIARSFYEMVTDVQVAEIGLCLHDDIDAGASPDGLIGDGGLLEIKCPLANTMIGYLRDQILPSQYIPQVQGQLWITGRDWCDFLAYHPNTQPLLIRVDRDEKYIDALVAVVSEAVDVININFDKLRRK